MDVLEPQIDTVDDLCTVLPVTVRIQFQTGSATLVCHTVLDLTKAIVVWISKRAHPPTRVVTA